MMASPIGRAVSTEPKTSVLTVVKAVSKTVFIASVILLYLSFPHYSGVKLFYIDKAYRLENTVTEQVQQSP